MSAKARIVLCDDHPIVLAGLRSLIEAEKEFELVGEAADGLAALKLIQEVQPDLAVIDISMPQLNGIMLGQRLAKEYPSVHVLVLTLHEDRVFAKQAIEAGIRGYVLKRSAADNLTEAMRVVLSGGTYVDPAIAHEVLPKARSMRRSQLPTDAVTGATTARETSVLKLAARGFTNKEIARRLDIGVKSVETYKARGLEKLGLRTRAELVRYAATRGWLAEL
jgi:DNA-binding NarL/FixJ family response regulator